MITEKVIEIKEQTATCDNCGDTIVKIATRKEMVEYLTNNGWDTIDDLIFCKDCYEEIEASVLAFCGFLGMIALVWCWLLGIVPVSVGSILAFAFFLVFGIIAAGVAGRGNANG